MGSSRQSARGRGAGGFTLLELVVVVVIVALLAVAAMHRLLVLQAAAERATLQAVVGTLQSALGMKFAERWVKQDWASIAALEGSNPMDQLAQLPPNYLGALAGADPAKLADGNWYFDTDAGVLVYLVRNGTGFRGGLAEPARARFAVRLVYEDRHRNGRFDRGVDEVRGVRLETLEPYAWEL
jgi:general secretion pathway protein G